MSLEKDSDGTMPEKEKTNTMAG